jgi:hypothetical protein
MREAIRHLGFAVWLVLATGAAPLGLGLRAPGFSTHAFDEILSAPPVVLTGWWMTQSDANRSLRQPVNRLTLKRRLTGGG